MLYQSAYFYLSSCASRAEVAAGAGGEVAKDENFLAAVEKVGTDFIPLLVKHTPLFLKILQIITYRATPCSSVFGKLLERTCYSNYLGQQC